MRNSCSAYLIPYKYPLKASLYVHYEFSLTLEEG